MLGNGSEGQLHVFRGRPRTHNNVSSDDLHIMYRTAQLDGVQGLARLSRDATLLRTQVCIRVPT